MGYELRESALNYKGIGTLKPYLQFRRSGAESHCVGISKLPADRVNSLPSRYNELG